MKSLSKVFVVLAVCLLAGSASAQAPEMFRYQGRLVDGTNLVNATLPMSFKLYDAQTDGALLYEDSNSVLVVDGLYATMIGNDTVSGSLTNALTNTAVYLELTIDGETLSPRERLVSVPYALGTESGDTEPSGSITLSEIHPNPELEANGYSAIESLLGRHWHHVGSIPFADYGEAEAHVWNGKIWVVTREKNADRISVWCTEDGLSWENTTTDIGATFELDYEVVVFKDKLWAFGGYAGVVGYDYFSEVWASADGTNWTLQTDSPGWSPRRVYAVVVKDNMLWLIGGTETTSFTDVWNSANGINWTQMTTSTPFAGAYAVEFQEKIWAFNNSGSWSSENGIDWTQLSSSPVLPPSDHLFVLNNSMALLGTTRLSQSSDGINKTLVFADIEAEGGPISAVYENKLWRFGKNFCWVSSPIEQTSSGDYYYRKD